MKLYTSSQIVRAVLFSVAGTAVLACAIFFYRENKNQISNTTQIEYNEETVNSEQKNQFFEESQEVSSGMVVSSSASFSKDEQQNIYVYEKCNEAVVNINTKETAYTWFLEPFVQDGGSGSGSIIDSEGHILTNVHVIQNASKIYVSLYDGSQYEAKIVGYDLKRNVAHLAAQKNADEILRMVLTATDKNGKNILNIDEPCKEKVIRGFTPAHFAASNFAHKSIQVLKELGADLNASAQNKTPMMVALQNGSRSVVSYLLEQPELDLTIKDKQGLTAYDYAIHFRTPIEDVQKIKEKLLEQKKSQTKKVSHKARTISIDSEHTKA